MSIDLEKWKSQKKLLGLTIADIAERADLPKGTVQNIFCGYIPNPRIDTVQAIERALGIGDAPPQAKSEETKKAPSGVATDREHFLQKYGNLVSDRYFDRYVKIYSLLTQEQRIYILGYLVAGVEQFGITYSDIG